MYLLRRAAEVTLQNGYTHFVIQMRDTQRMTDYLGSPYPYGYGYGYYAYGGDTWVTSSYSSYAEILLLKDTEVANTADAVDAQRVLASLSPQEFSPFKTAGAAQ
jgi:hypothetical protein